MLKTNRGIIKYILLNIITCGIYSLFFFHGLAKDMNTVAAGDGKNTAGLIKYLLFSLITCGIYSFVWHYNLGNRMVDTGAKYGINIHETGTTILLWMILGSLLFGIGPFIAMHFTMRNMNDLCTAYNKAHN